MRLLFILSAVLALQTGFASAADPKPVVKQKCTACGDSCACPAGFCPSRCAVKGNADDAWLAVAKGGKVTLCIGVTAEPGAYATGPKKGYTNGVYECFLHNGVPSMNPKAAAVTYSVGNPFATPCSGGSCPAPSSRRR